MPIPLTNGADLCGQRLRNLGAAVADSDATNRAVATTVAQTAASAAAGALADDYDDTPSLVLMFENGLA